MTLIQSFPVNKVIRRDEKWDDRLRLLEKAARNTKTTKRTRNISALELKQGGYLLDTSGKW